MDGLTLREMTATDGVAVLSIFSEGIAGGNATFESETPTWDAWDAGKLTAPRLIAEIDGAVVGWGALSACSSRHVYRGVTEVSVYIADAAQGCGVGRAVLERLISASEAAGIWTLEAGVFPENAASVALHQRCGFEEIGLRRRIGLARVGPYSGQWRDVVLMERRSAGVGV